MMGNWYFGCGAFIAVMSAAACIAQEAKRLPAHFHFPPVTQDESLSIFYDKGRELEHQERPHMVVDGHRTNALWMGKRPACWKIAPDSHLLHADHATWVWNGTTHKLTKLGSSCYVDSIVGLGTFVFRREPDKIRAGFEAWQLFDFNPMTGEPRVVWTISDKTHMPIVIGQRDGNLVVKIRDDIITLGAGEPAVVRRFALDPWSVFLDRSLCGDAVRGQHVLLYQFDDAELPAKEQLRRLFGQHEYNVEYAVLHLDEGTIRKIGATPGRWIRTPGDGGMASRHFRAAWISPQAYKDLMKRASDDPPPKAPRNPDTGFGITTYVCEDTLKLLPIEQD